MNTRDSQSGHASLRSILVVLGVIAAAALIVGGLYTRVPMVIDGLRAQAGVGDSVGEVLARHADLSKPGDLLSASDKRVVRPGGGRPATVTLNGRPATAATRVGPGDTIEITPGSDAIEPTIEETRSIPAPAKFEGSGSIVTVEESGASGVERIVVGTVSGDVVESETVVPARPMVIRRLSHINKKVVALTFDDGPWPGQTQKILDILAAEDVNATFFVVGSRVKSRSALVARAVREGNEIGNHSYRHADLTEIGAKRIRSEIAGTNAVVKRASGVTPEWFRPPGGRIDGAGYAELRRQGLQPVLWSVDPQDWRANRKASQIARSVVSAAGPGSVILLHDGGGDRTQTIKALPWIIHELKKRGYTFVLLGDLPGKPKSRW